MKKTYRLFAVALYFLVLVGSATGCSFISGSGSVDHVPEGFDETLPVALEQEIQDAWYAEKGRKLIGYVYYGTYGDCVVLFRPGMMTMICSEEIAGSTFSYGTNFTLTVYRRGKICSLQEAYEKGYLSKDQIAVIADYHVLYKEYDESR